MPLNTVDIARRGPVKLLEGSTETNQAFNILHCKCIYISPYLRITMYLDEYGLYLNTVLLQKSEPRDQKDHLTYMLPLLGSWFLKGPLNCHFNRLSR